jgi:hypothetical protein
METKASASKDDRDDKDHIIQSLWYMIGQIIQYVPDYIYERSPKVYLYTVEAYVVSAEIVKKIFYQRLKLRIQ